MDSGSLPIVFWVILKQFSSSVFFAMAMVDDDLPGQVCQILDCLGIVALVPEVGVMVHMNFCHRQEKMVFLLWQGWVLLYTLQRLDWCIFPNWTDPFHRVSWVYMWDTCEILLVFYCFEGGKVWKNCDQCQVVEILDPLGDFLIQCHCLIVCI